MDSHAGAQNACGCRATHLSASRSPADSGSAKTASPESKYFQEIGAEMIGNQLIIRVEKDKNRPSRRKAGQWDPPCDCSVPEIRMASATRGPRIVNAGDNNQILFRIRSRNLVGKEDTNYKPEAFAYQLGAAKKGKDSSDQHRTITIHPQLGDPAASQEVHSDHITDGNQNIYLLRIKKKAESANQRRRNIELELRTPKPAPARKVLPDLSRNIEVPKKTPEREIPAESVEGAGEAGKKAEKKKTKKKK